MSKLLDPSSFPIRIPVAAESPLKNPTVNPCTGKVNVIAASSAVPMCPYIALVFKFEITKVYALLSVEEIARLVIGAARVKSRKWIDNITHKNN